MVLEVQMKFIFQFLLISLSLFASEEVNQQDVDNLLLYEAMVKKISNGVEFDYETKLLEKHFDGSLIHIIKGMLAYGKGDKNAGYEAFNKIRENDPLFAFTNEKWYQYATGFSGGVDKKAYDTLAINRYGTYLRDSVEHLESGCCLALESHYRTLIEGDLEKIKEFERWRQSMAVNFDQKAPGNWYLPYGRLEDRGANRLAKACDVVESKLLGDPADPEIFRESWQKIRNLRPVEKTYYTFWLGGFSVDILFEETRANILIGHNEPSIKMLNKLYTNILNRYRDELQNAYLSHFFYLKGLHLYLQGENKHMLGKDAFDIITGKNGAAVQLYLSGLKFKENKWSLKAKKLYQQIQADTLERYGRRMKDYPEFGSGIKKAPVKK